MESADVLVLGSGFSGSLLAMILAKQGRRVAVVDVNEHPRFAIGESTTPLGDLTLKEIATTYDLPELHALTSYGAMREQLPGLRCGRKRGFTYFGFTHDNPGHDLASMQHMLVAASESDYLSDTHWMRSDVDQYLLLVAMAYGVKFCLGCDYQLSKAENGWKLSGKVMDQEVNVSADFLVDATGVAGKVFEVLEVPQQADVLKTNSQAVYGHFRGLKRMGAMLHDAGVDLQQHPYECDDAAVHHVLKEGWMWQLPFDDGTTSVGMVWDAATLQQMGLSGTTSLEKQWADLIRESPILKQQFESADVIRPDEGVVTTGRLQRLTTQAAGDDWAALPSTAGCVDPLHSTGIAHALFGVRRLADILLNSSGHSKTIRLARYSEQLINEFKWIDELVECCYVARSDIRLWFYATLLHFCSVTSQEKKTADKRSSQESFLRADDQRFREVFREARSRIAGLASGPCSAAKIESLRVWLQSATADWNSVGLFRDADDFCYTSTAVSDEIRQR